MLVPERIPCGRFVSNLRLLLRGGLDFIPKRAGTGLFVLILLGQAVALAQVKCKGHHKVTPPTVVGGGAEPDRIIAEQRLAKSVVQFCDNQCAAFACTTGGCRASGKAGIKGQPLCTLNATTQQWSCQAEVSACPCDCFTCDGGQSPIGPYDTGLGVDANRQNSQTEAANDAAALCTEFCARFACPGDPAPTCATNNLALGGIHCKKDGANLICSQQIRTCTCRCGT
jgi:hypothetical protein